MLRNEKWGTLSGMRIALTALVGLLLVPAALATTRPHVRLAASTPAGVTGTGFRHGERVLVRVGNGKVVLAKRVRTSSRGSFTARFLHNVVTPQCGQVTVTATGQLGDRATWESAPPVCGTPIQPVDQ